MNNKPLCYAPFIGLYATGYNQYAPCCVAKKERYKNTNPKEFWVSKEMQDIRMSLLEHKWPNKCEFCKIKEQKGLTNETVIWETLRQKVDVGLDIEYGNTTKGPLFLDYRPSNLCNLKCRMCVPNSSSQIEAEFIHNPELQKWFSAKKKEVVNFEEFKKFTSEISLKQIKILGGEPTIDPLVIEFLESICKHYEKLPSLRITTNSTNLNAKFKSILKKFSDIHIVFSIDATDSVYDYIRTNANWKKVKKNTESIFENKLATWHGFNVVLMPYNIFNLTDLLSWFKSLKDRGYNNFSVFFDTSDVDYTGLGSILPEDTDYALECLQKWNNENPGMETEVDEIVQLILKVEFNNNLYKNFIEYNNSLDNIRKTKLINIHERFKKYV
jgi:sulfatase maturation enzyme AslB (radical SAM superfamily)